MNINALIIILVVGLAGENLGSSIAKWILRQRYTDRMQALEKGPQTAGKRVPMLIAILIVNAIFYLPFAIALIMSLVTGGPFINRTTLLLSGGLLGYALIRGILTFYLTRRKLLAA